MVTPLLNLEPRTPQTCGKEQEYWIPLKICLSLEADEIFYINSGLPSTCFSCQLALKCCWRIENKTSAWMHLDPHRWKHENGSDNSISLSNTSFFVQGRSSYLVTNRRFDGTGWHMWLACKHKIFVVVDASDCLANHFKIWIDEEKFRWRNSDVGTWADTGCLVHIFER